jgi:DNA polymerase III subunit delta'
MTSSADIIGQDSAVRFLTNALEQGTVAHAYLFSGSDGVGKRLLARRFAQALNCEHQGRNYALSACSCASCQKIEREIHPDIMWVGLDEEENSIKIETIRNLASSIYLRPFEGNRKVIIINKAERMTEEAANAFLKTLEEPPASTNIVLLAEQPSQLFSTILSRVVEVKLYPLPLATLRTVLERDYGCGDESAVLASLAQGSLGVALKYMTDKFIERKNKIIDDFTGIDAVSFFLDAENSPKPELDELLSVLCSFMNDVLILGCGLDEMSITHKDRVADVRRVMKQVPLEAVIEITTLLDESRNFLKRSGSSKLIFLRLAARLDALMKGKRGVVCTK